MKLNYRRKKQSKSCSRKVNLDCIKNLKRQSLENDFDGCRIMLTLICIAFKAQYFKSVVKIGVRKRFKTLNTKKNLPCSLFLPIFHQFLHLLLTLNSYLILDDGKTCASLLDKFKTVQQIYGKRINSLICLKILIKLYLNRYTVEKVFHERISNGQESKVLFVTIYIYNHCLNLVLRPCFKLSFSFDGFRYFSFLTE